jgi:hypothetical protein
MTDQNEFDVRQYDNVRFRLLQAERDALLVHSQLTGTNGNEYGNSFRIYMFWATRAVAANTGLVSSEMQEFLRVNEKTLLSKTYSFGKINGQRIVEAVVQRLLQEQAWRASAPPCPFTVDKITIKN